MRSKERCGRFLVHHGEGLRDRANRGRAKDVLQEVVVSPERVQHELGSDAAVREGRARVDEQHRGAAGIARDLYERPRCLLVRQRRQLAEEQALRRRELEIAVLEGRLELRGERAGITPLAGRTIALGLNGAAPDGLPQIHLRQDGAGSRVEHGDLAAVVADDGRPGRRGAADDVARVRVHPAQGPFVGGEAHHEAKVGRIEAIGVERERASGTARPRVQPYLVRRAGDRPQAFVAGDHELRRAWELARWEREMRRLTLAGALDAVVEAEEADLSEVEAAADRPCAARLLAEEDAAGFIAVRQVEDRHVLVAPRNEREVRHHGGRAEVLVRLCLTHDFAVVSDGQEHRPGATCAREGDGRDRAVVARAVDLQAARGPRPELRACLGVEREELSAAGSHDDARSDDGPGIERMRVRPAGAALQG